MPPKLKRITPRTKKYRKDKKDRKVIKKSSPKTLTKKSSPKSQKKKSSPTETFSPKTQIHTYSENDMIFYPQNINSMMMDQDPPYKYPTEFTGNMEKHTDNSQYELGYKSPLNYNYREELPPLMGRKSLSLGGKKRRTRKYKGAAKRLLPPSLSPVDPRRKVARVGFLNTPQGIENINGVMNPAHGNHSPHVAQNLGNLFELEDEEPQVEVINGITYYNGLPSQGGKRKSRRKSRRKSMSRR